MKWSRLKHDRAEVKQRLYRGEVSPKGQVVLPKEIREKLGIQAGALLRVAVSGERIELEPLPKKIVDRLYGRFANSKLVESLERDHAHEIASEKGR